jgi:predicted HTH transcriptional regulator
MTTTWISSARAGSAREAKVAEPVFELSGFFRVTSKRNTPVQSTAPGDRKAIAGDWQAIRTSDRKRVILSYIKERGQATASETAELLDLSKGRVRAILQEMASEGTIEKVGNNRYAYYVPKQ